MPSIQKINDDILRKLDRSFATAEARGKQLGARLKAQYLDAYHQVDNQLTAMLKRMPELSMNEAMKYNRLLNLEKNIRDELAKLGQQNVASISGTIRENLGAGYYGTMYSVDSSIPVALSFTKLNTDAIKAAVADNYELIKWPENSRINVQQLNSNVRHAITQGLIQGQSVEKVSRNMMNEMDKNLRGQFTKGYNGALRIARTETLRAYSVGQDLAWDEVSSDANQEKVMMLKFWIATLDQVTRADHGAEDGNFADKDGYFTVGGSRMTAPRLSGDPAQDINCRCSIGMKVDENMPARRLDNITEQDVPYISAQDWAKENNIKFN